MLKRVSKIKVKDEQGNLYDAPYDAGAKYETEAANDRFGLMGERVLAFARIDLDPSTTPFNKNYQFDTRNWADWDMKDDVGQP